MTVKDIVGFAALTAMTLFVLAACRPEPTVIEVTRLVEVAPPPDPTTPTALATAPESTPTPLVVTTVITALVTVEVTRQPLGTEGRPVQLLFPPTTSTTVIARRGQVLADALTEATGVEFVVGIPDDEQTLIELLCTAPGDAIGILSPAAYVLAAERCDVQPGLVARHDDLAWQSEMLVVGSNSGLWELADLQGKTWAAAEPNSLPALYFRAALAEAGVEVSEPMTFAEDSSALLALDEGEVDFTTADFAPPIMPREREWVYGRDDPEAWRQADGDPYRSGIGYVLVLGEPAAGGYRLRDARSRLFDINNRIFNRTRILTISPPIPNEAVVFGADFPLALARDVLAVLPDFAASESCVESLCSADFYNWSGLAPIDDSAYDPIRTIIDKLDMEPVDLWQTVTEGSGE